MVGQEEAECCEGRVCNRWVLRRRRRPSIEEGGGVVGCEEGRCCRARGQGRRRCRRIGVSDRVRIRSRFGHEERGMRSGRVRRGQRPDVRKAAVGVTA